MNEDGTNMRCSSISSSRGEITLSVCTPLARQVRDSAQSFLTVHVPLHVSYIYVTAPRGWASLEHHTEMEFSFFYDTVLWRTGILTDVLTGLTLCLSSIFFFKYCVLMVAAFLILLSYIQTK